MVNDQSTDDQRRAAAVRPNRNAAATKWMQRFRKRWNLCLGRLPAKVSCLRQRCKARSVLQGYKGKKKVANPGDHFWVHRADPKMGPCVCFCDKMRSKKTEPFLSNFRTAEATAVWQWFDFLQAQVRHGRPVLRLNLDKTSVTFCLEPRQALCHPKGQVPRIGLDRKLEWKAVIMRRFLHGKCDCALGYLDAQWWPMENQYECLCIQALLHRQQRDQNISV